MSRILMVKMSENVLYVQIKHTGTQKRMKKEGWEDSIVKEILW